MLTRTRAAPALLRSSLLLSCMLLAACTKLGFTAVNTPSYIMGNLHAERDLAYGDRPHQKLDLYLPQDRAAMTGELVVFIYGGGWTSGNRGDYYFVADALTSAGYAVAIPDYIKYPQARFPTFVEDIALALAWLSDNIDRYADISGLVLMGHSAGAHTGALLLADPRYLAAHRLQPGDIDAFIGMAGPYGFTPEEQKYRNVFANLDDFSQMQPLHFADGDEPAMLLLHGGSDRTVLPVNTRSFAEKVNRQGGSATVRIYPGSGHVELVLSLSRLPGPDKAPRGEVIEFLTSRQAAGAVKLATGSRN